MKIALYLGSFNPFHKGHLKVIESALINFKMDRVIIVPTMQNPWKNVIDIDKRIDIIRKSITNIVIGYGIDRYYEEYDHGNLIEERYPIYITNRALISEIEKQLTPPYYSYATLHALKNKYCNDEIYVLVGEDTIEDIPNWMHGEQILKDYDFLICDRTPISSTEIRERIKSGKDFSDLVNINVDLIKNYYGHL